jgi:hypothetical protein
MRVRRRRRRLLSSVAIAALLAVGCAHGKPPSKGEHPMVPNEVNIPVPALQRTLLFAAPAYVSTSVEDTPYQWLQLCNAGGKSCRTLLDVRGAGGVSMPADKTLGLSPDGRYLLCFRMTGVDAAGKSYRSQYYELYDLVEGKAVTFNTEAGVTATTDNVQGWSADRPHALEVSTTFRKTSLAFPPGEN